MTIDSLKGTVNKIVISSIGIFINLSLFTHIEHREVNPTRVRTRFSDSSEDRQVFLDFCYIFRG